MKLVIISDTHDKLLEDVPDGDVLIHCGDYSVFGEYDETKKFFDWFSSQKHEYKIVIPGNHEVAICPIKKLPNKAKIMDLIKSYTNVHFLSCRELVINGIKFYGAPWCGGDRFVMYRWGFYLEHDSDRQKMFKFIPDDTNVLITHSPPYGILDTFCGRHLGCPMLLERVRQLEKLKVHCFGHIHGANGIVEENGVQFCNCSNLGENYKITYPCRIIELN